jgi:hypothetical protein
MLAVGSVWAVAVHSASSSIVVVATSTRWVSAPEAVVIASRIRGTAFALTPVASSFVVALRTG